jgi:hypothetical protein
VLLVMVRCFGRGESQSCHAHTISRLIRKRNNGTDAKSTGYIVDGDDLFRADIFVAML